jgi:hypothetical protein
MSWSFRRQALYYAVAGFILIVVLFGAWRAFFVRTPTCFDGVKNGIELGVDCGGACALICSDTAKAPVVLWARSFEVSPQTYSAAAYVQNLNLGAGARGVKYSFQLFDSTNLLIAERDGTVDLPPVHTIPIVESGINVGTRTVARTLFSFSGLPVWHTNTTEIVPLHLTQQSLNPDASRLSANVVNDSAQDAAHVTVAVVLFDGKGVARAASKTVIDSLPRKSQKPIIFTWPGGVPNIVRAEMSILPAF